MISSFFSKHKIKECDIHYTRQFSTLHAPSPPSLPPDCMESPSKQVQALSSSRHEIDSHTPRLLARVLGLGSNSVYDMFSLAWSRLGGGCRAQRLTVGDPRKRLGCACPWNCHDIPPTTSIKYKTRHPNLLRVQRPPAFYYVRRPSQAFFRWVLWIHLCFPLRLLCKRGSGGRRERDRESSGGERERLWALLQH